ncbi:hypothetical protein [Ramlibacter sp. Leaf400]|uniref:hypothetical protein n=1 Tax=Ramlibacter sp. Leaf400 TaxID=1736365 RepID=UPI0006FE845F|nr:hypothetical protein [Ramlibacter sp. Leaf400]KQT10834.1 hypothetical protein ASG30_08465 [Ramlibacter sp. Leaf400]
MTLTSISGQLAARGVKLTREELSRLGDERRLQDAAVLLAQLRDRHGITLPRPTGAALAEADSAQQAARLAREHERRFAVITVDRAADGSGLFRATGFNGLQAALALTGSCHSAMYCIAGLWL